MQLRDCGACHLEGPRGGRVWVGAFLTLPQAQQHVLDDIVRIGRRWHMTADESIQVRASLSCSISKHEKPQRAQSAFLRHPRSQRADGARSAGVYSPTEATATSQHVGPQHDRSSLHGSSEQPDWQHNGEPATAVATAIGWVTLPQAHRSKTGRGLAGVRHGCGTAAGLSNTKTLATHDGRRQTVRFRTARSNCDRETGGDPRLTTPRNPGLQRDSHGAELRVARCAPDAPLAAISDAPAEWSAASRQDAGATRPERAAPPVRRRRRCTRAPSRVGDSSVRGRHRSA